jgi:hypothetical protein
MPLPLWQRPLVRPGPHRRPTQQQMRSEEGARREQQRLPLLQLDFAERRDDPVHGWDQAPLEPSRQVAKALLLADGSFVTVRGDGLLSHADATGAAGHRAVRAIGRGWSGSSGPSRPRPRWMRAMCSG